MDNISCDFVRGANVGRDGPSRQCDGSFSPWDQYTVPEQDSVVRVRQRSSLPSVGDGGLQIEDCHFLMHEFSQTAHQNRSDYGERLLIQWETVRAAKRGTAIGDGTDLLSTPEGRDLEDFLEANMKLYEEEQATVEAVFLQSLCDACPPFSYEIFDDEGIHDSSSPKSKDVQFATTNEISPIDENEFHGSSSTSSNVHGSSSSNQVFSHCDKSGSSDW